jgi:hypothetical protein
VRRYIWRIENIVAVVPADIDEGKQPSQLAVTPTMTTVLHGRISHA